MSVKSSAPLFVIRRTTSISSSQTPAIGISEILSTTISGELKIGIEYRLKSLINDTGLEEIVLKSTPSDQIIFHS